jgi:hypothetical protein
MNKRIEIIAVGRDRLYSVGSVVVSQNGDVYLISRIKHVDSHLSRHASGEVHLKSAKINIDAKLGKRKPVNEFKGLEFLQTVGFGIDSLPSLYEEYKIKKCNGLFAIDMKEYEHAHLNMQFFILTMDALPSLLGKSPLRKKQFYIFPDSSPMVGIIVGDFKKEELSEEN